MAAVATRGDGRGGDERRQDFTHAHKLVWLKVRFPMAVAFLPALGRAAAGPNSVLGEPVFWNRAEPALAVLPGQFAQQSDHMTRF